MRWGEARLSRLAGLRWPSEFGVLTWGAINWKKGRLTALAKKTEHHGGDHAVRVVPICPELRATLAEAFEQADTGATLLVPMAARKTVNLRTYLEKSIIKAGHEPWPRLLQNLRASCETDWVEKYPSHVVAKWLGHSPKVAAQHYLMSREHHFDDVVAGGSAAEPSVAGAGQAVPESCSADCSAPATQNATQQASAPDSARPHKTTEPAATIQVAAGSSKLAPVTETDRMAGTGTEQTRFHSGKQGVESSCDAECDAISGDRIELPAQAVALIAGMGISEDERMAVRARLTAATASTMVVLPTGRATIIRLPRHHGKSRQSMTTVQEIEKAIEALPLADQLRLYRDLPHLIGSVPEELDWQRLAIEEFFKDDSPDDSVYDSI